MSYLSAPNLGQGLSGWRPLNISNAVTLGAETNPGIARTTTSFAYARTTQGGASVALDFAWPDIEYKFDADQNGNLTQITLQWPAPSITVIAWVRARPGQPNFNYQLSLWGLGAAPQPHDYVNGVATQAWQMVTISAANAAQRTRRVEFYLATTGSDLLIDSVNVF
jgi:hypothetical protein